MEKNLKKPKKCAITICLRNAAALRNSDFWEYMKKFGIVGLTETWEDAKVWDKMQGPLLQKFR